LKIFKSLKIVFFEIVCYCMDKSNYNRDYNLPKMHKISTVSSTNRMLCCEHSPSKPRTCLMSFRMSLPLIRAVLDVAGIIPVSIDIVVVLPALLWPSSTVIWSGTSAVNNHTMNFIIIRWKIWFPRGFPIFCGWWNHETPNNALLPSFFGWFG
jgi:hypothetical protein